MILKPRNKLPSSNPGMEKYHTSSRLRGKLCLIPYTFLGDYRYCSVPFQVSSMMCKKCQEYGHTLKGCRKTNYRCRKCSKCHHCSEEHLAGFKGCLKQQEEQKILVIVEKEKVAFQRARQIATEKPINRTLGNNQTPTSPAQFDVTLPKNV